MRRLTVLLLLAATCAVVAAAPAPACACGIALQADVVRERALVIQRGVGREEIVASFDLEVDGPDGRAAVVLPVPGDPTVMAVEGDPLGYLDEATRPDVPDGGTDDTAAAGAGPPRGVDVIGRETVGGYDVSRLRADDPRALGRWLTANGYALPASAAPILDEYVDRGWRYVAIRLAPGEQGALKPLRVAFPSRQLVYPMRLSSLATSPVSVTLYVVAGGEQQVPVLSTPFSAPLDRLDPPPPADVAPLLAGGRHLTKFVADGLPPSAFARDLVFTPARAGASSPSGGEALPWWLATGFVVALAATGVLVARRPPRRPV